MKVVKPDCWYFSHLNWLHHSTKSILSPYTETRRNDRWETRRRRRREQRHLINSMSMSTTCSSWYPIQTQWKLFQLLPIRPQLGPVPHLIPLRGPLHMDYTQLLYTRNKEILSALLFHVHFMDCCTQLRHGDTGRTCRMYPWDW